MQKYREAILYIVLLAVLCYAALMQVKPKFQDFISNHKSVVEKQKLAGDLKAQLEASKLQAQKLEQARIAHGILAKVVFQPQTLSLDNESGYSVMFNDIFEMAKNNHIKTYSIQYEYNPENDPFVKANQNYKVCLLKMKIIGDYTDFENFLTDLYKYPYFINLSSFDIVPYYKNKNVLLIRLGVKVYMQGDGSPDGSTPVTPDVPPVPGANGAPAPAPAAVPTPALPTN